MKVSAILKIDNIQELKLLGSYCDVKNCLEKELGSKLGVIGWKSFFEKVNVLKEVVPLNKDYLTAICDESSFKESKNNLSKLLGVKIKAKNLGELRSKIKNITLIFCSNIFDPHDYYEKTKLNKFKHSSKLEGIDIKIPDETDSLDSVLAKYRR